MTERKLGVCVVGAGAMGARHAEGWSTVDEARLVAVADVDEGRARRLAEKYGFSRWTTDYRDAVASDEVDVVCVLPSGGHGICGPARKARPVREAHSPHFGGR